MKGALGKGHVFSCRRKPEYPEETYADTGRTCKLHIERPRAAQESNPGPSCYEARALTAAPPCRPIAHHIAGRRAQTCFLGHAHFSSRLKSPASFGFHPHELQMNQTRAEQRRESGARADMRLTVSGQSSAVSPEKSDIFPQDGERRNEQCAEFGEEESAGDDMHAAGALRTLVTERSQAFAHELLALFERTVAQLEAEVRSLRADKRSLAQLEAEVRKLRADKRRQSSMVKQARVLLQKCDTKSKLKLANLTELSSVCKELNKRRRRHKHISRKTELQKLLLETNSPTLSDKTDLLTFEITDIRTLSENANFQTLAENGDLKTLNKTDIQTFEITDIQTLSENTNVQRLSENRDLKTVGKMDIQTFEITDIRTLSENTNVRTLAENRDLKTVGKMDIQTFSKTQRTDPR
ncbi:hypothetical protein WMY93_026372 [Mugilogobius chulae]|uniref:Uncharacterized protein n=1 Tax=Mugilogobius chulae TaxID=88201 RepID=A0AAW0N7I8_9GOBI